ncbi:MAG: hypothetical protein GY795_50450 [Desulfobacterales bacterium]|nr:hypothetical protein [Desulfobacterales bacterium]
MFLASSKSPARKTLDKYGYQSVEKSGVYKSNYQLVNAIPLISLNDLANDPNNALYRLFASKMREKTKALGRLMSRGISSLPETVKLFIMQTANFLLRRGGIEMAELTSEDRELISNFFDDFVFPNLPPEKILAKIKTEDILAKIKPEDILAKIKPKDWLADLKPEELDEFEACLREIRAKEKK